MRGLFGMVFLLTSVLLQSVYGSLISDNFESYSLGLPPAPPWEVRTFGTITINTVNTEQSPFGAAGDNQAVVYSDTSTVDPCSGVFWQNFISDSALLAAFDFKSDISGSGVPSFLLRDAENTIAIQLSFSRGGNRLIENRDMDGGFRALEAMAVGEWYHVEVYADTESDTFDLLLQRYGHAANTYTNLAFRNAVDELSQVVFINNAGGATKTTFVVDNVGVSSLFFANLQLKKRHSNPLVEWQRVGPGMSGYIDMFWIHDTDPNCMFMSLDMGNNQGTWSRGEEWNTIKDCDGTGGDLDTVGYIEFSHQDPDFGLAMAKWGIYSTTNRGCSWDFFTDPDPTESGKKHSVMTVDPNDDNIWYIGAGQHWQIKFTHFNKAGIIYSLDKNHSTGFILKSVDKGQTWTKITSIFPSDTDFSKIIIDPRDTDIIYASSQNGIYRSSDAGTNWVKVAGNGLPYNMPRDMVSYYDAGTGEFLLYVVEVTHYVPSGNTIDTHGGVYRSADGGANWENLTGNLGIDLNQVNSDYFDSRYYRAIAYWLEMDQATAESTYPVLPTNTFSQFIRIGVDPGNKNRIYLTHNFKHDYSFPPGNVWMTENGGTNWVAAAREGLYWDCEIAKTYWQSRNNPLGVNVKYAHVQKLHDELWDTITLAGPRFLMVNNIGEVYTAFAQQIMRSTDNGTTWNQIDDDETYPGSAHWVGRGDSNLHGVTICVDTGIDGRYLFGSEEHGLWRNTDDGELVCPGAVAVEQISGQSTAWYDALSISSIAVHPADPDKIYTLQFRQWQRGCLRYSSDAGESWQNLSTPVVFPNPGQDDTIKQYSLLIDPEVPANMYFCVPLSDVCYWTTSQWGQNGPTNFTAYGVYKSTDGGLSWNISNNGLPAGKSVYRLAFDANDSSILYAALNQTETLESGGLYKTTDGGGSWSPVTLPAGIASVNDICVNKANGDIFIACGTYSNDGSVGGAWVSCDGGATWQLIFDMPNVRKITSSIMDTDIVAVSAGQARLIDRINPGVYVSLNSGVSWDKININLGQPDRIEDLVADPNDSNALWCAQFGSGFWKADLFYLKHSPTYQVFDAVQDADVNSSDPNGTYGLNDELEMDASPVRNAYIQFDVNDLAGVVSKATLWVCNHNTSPLTGSLTAYESVSGWNETNVTWNSKHDLGDVISSRLVSIAGRWYPIDVTDYIVEDGAYTIGLQVDSETAGQVFSANSSCGAQPFLEVTTVP